MYVAQKQKNKQFDFPKYVMKNRKKNGKRTVRVNSKIDDF